MPACVFSGKRVFRLKFDDLVRHQGKTAQRLPGQVPIDQLFLKRLENNPALSLQVDQKMQDALGENADPPQMPHVGTDMNGIDPLLGGVHPKHLRQDLRRCRKEFPVQTLLSVKHLVIYHILPPLPPLLNSMFLGNAAKYYQGPITVGIDGLLISLPANSDKISIKQILK